MKSLVYTAIAAYFVVIAIMLFLYFRPKFINEPFLKEGFSTIALDGEKIPKCFLRDTEAQRLLASFQGIDNTNTRLAYDELKLILQKALCTDADVTGPAGNTFTTYNLPFATSHDIEPTASFVGRCVRKVVRERDIEMMIDKYRTRGSTLINQMCDNNARGTALLQFHAILDRVKSNITPYCVAPKANLDIPSGARDPGYYESDAVKNLTPYQISGGGVQYI